MATHLWRRSSGWTYQRRVPKHLVNSFGAVIRAPLGRLSAQVAKEQARLISVRLDALWSTEIVSGDGAEGADGVRLPKADELVAELFGALAKHRQTMQRAADVMGMLNRQRLTAVEERDAKAQESEKLAKEGKRLKGAVAALADGREPPEPLPLFSIQATSAIDAKAEAKPESTYPPKLRNVARAWVLVMGDREVDEYRPSEIQDFANKLKKFPRNWAVTPRYRTMTADQVIEDTERAIKRAADAEKELPKLFSQTNIKEYSAQVGHLFHLIRAAFPKQVNDFQRAPLVIPSEAREAAARGSVPVPAMNLWFRAAAKERRPDDRYLPVVGAVTGARLSELVYLRAGDLKEMYGRLILDLIDDAEGVLESDQKRRLKTLQSRRRVVLHEAIRETGFVEWARSLPSESWMFPRLHVRNGQTAVERPHGAASKRMTRQMQDLGIHVPYVCVYHSLRHGIKDWHLWAKIADRTSRLQSGHAFADVAQSYGSKELLEHEIHELATMPLLPGLDLSPYTKK